MRGVVGSSTCGGRLCASLAGAWLCGVALGGGLRCESFQAKEGLQEAQALWLQYAAFRDFEVVVDPWQGVEIGRAPEAPHFRVRHRVADSLDACHEQCAGAHGAWFLGHVDRRFGKAPVRDLPGRLCEGEHLGVGCGIVCTFDGVVRCGDDVAMQLNDAPDRHFVLAPRVDGLVKGKAHEKLIIAE